MNDTDLPSIMESVARHLLGEPSKVMSSRTELRVGSKGSLAVQIGGDDMGTWYDFEVGYGGGVLDLVMAQKRLPKADAVQWLRRQSFMCHDVITLSRRCDDPSCRREVSNDGRNIDRAQGIWEESIDPAGTIVETYLRQRGVSLPDAPVIRFHPTCPRKDGPLPTMVALMTFPCTCAPCSIHRTYLQSDGSGKADIPSPKMLLGMRGVIRLVDSEDIGIGLGLAEGIETALTVMQRIGWGPVWAATCTAAIASFPVLPATTLNIFADHDPPNVRTGIKPGLKAAQDCANRWHAARQEVFIHIPPAGEDWNDAARRLAA